MKIGILLFLCFSLIVTLLCSACAKKPDDVPPAEDYSDAKVTYQYEYVWELLPYEEVGERNWLDFDDVYGVATNWYYGPDIEVVPWSSDMLPEIEPNSTIKVTKKIPYTYIHAGAAVSAYLESGENTEKNFVLFPIGYKLNPKFRGIEHRDASLTDWCKTFAADGCVVERTGHVLWQGNADDLKKMNEEINAFPVMDPIDPIGAFRCEVLVCFAEEFDDLYGVSLEQAQVLIEHGCLDMWCLPTVEDSPLYGLEPFEITAYLADHPELLEENA